MSAIQTLVSSLPANLQGAQGNPLSGISGILQGGGQGQPPQGGGQPQPPMGGAPGMPSNMQSLMQGGQ